MAECSHARCLQERRLIKRELMKWSKDMLHIVGLERVAEELMGRRKWKHYQEALTRTHLSTEQLTAAIDQASERDSKLETDIKVDTQQQPQEKQQQQELLPLEEAGAKITQPPYEENHRPGEGGDDDRSRGSQSRQHSSPQPQEADVDVGIAAAVRIKTEAEADVAIVGALIAKAEREVEKGDKDSTSHNHNNNNNNNNNNINNNNNNNTTNIITNHNNSTAFETNYNNNNNNSNYNNCTSLSPAAAAPTTTTTPTPTTPPPPEPVDWTPNEKCHFCIDGKLLTVNAKGELVAESGPADQADLAHVHAHINAHALGHGQTHAHALGHGHRQLIDTESDSNDSFSVARTPSVTSNAANIAVAGTAAAAAAVVANSQRANVNHLLGDLPANMTSMDSMAAHFAAMQTIAGPLYPNLNWIFAQQQQQQQQQPQHQQQQQQQQQHANSATPTTSETSAAAVSPSLKDSPSPSDATGEQPLDLSSKPSPNSSISGDHKSSSTRSLALRATPLPAGRRAYTDGDLKNALQDIILGKLGTRKAAAQYNIPRSTLRNKVYKLTMDSKREAPAPDLLQFQLQQVLELDKDLSGDDGEDSSHSTPQPQPEATPLDDLASRIAGSAAKLRNNVNVEDGDHHASSSPKPLLTTALAEQLKRKPNVAGHPQQQASPQPQAPAMPTLDLSMLMHSLLLSPALAAPLGDLLRLILLNSKDAPAAVGAGEAMNNGGEKTAMLAQQLLLQQLQQLQQHQQQQQQPSPSATPFAHRLPKSDTPETSSSLELNEGSDDPSVILKIPSFKPLAGGSNASATAPPPGCGSAAGSPAPLGGGGMNASRNGDSPLLAAAVGGSRSADPTANSLSVISPPLMRHGLGGGESLHDVIASTIHRAMNDQSTKDAHAAAASMLGLGSGGGGASGDAGSNGSSSNNSNNYRKPSISVVKNIGGTNTSCFGSASNLLDSGHNSHHAHGHGHAHQQQHQQHLSHHAAHQAHLSRQEALAGKGTRPKRGKYRNYDRDSLVEAVKAVQRGEMSVHRAGSYYGVPHSTLEYKVKERHLMRPRKREPKPQPLDGAGAGSAKGGGSGSGIDKLKAAANSASKAGSLKNSSSSNNNSSNSPAAQSAAAFPTTSPNGMKLSMFDAAAAAAQLQYAPQLFWPQSAAAAAFGTLPMDFNRNASQGGSGAGGSGNAAGNNAVGSPYVNPEILKSHIQRYQEESRRSLGGHGHAHSHKSAHSPSPAASPMPGQNHHAALGFKGGRDYGQNADSSMFEAAAGGANGSVSSSSSLLDGIIRKGLDRKSSSSDATHLHHGHGHAHHHQTPTGGGALLDQLLVKKTPLPFTNAAFAQQLKRSASPLPPYATVDIKRERSSPVHSDGGDGDDCDASNSELDEQQQHHHHGEHNNNKNNNNSITLATSGNGASSAAHHGLGGLGMGLAAMGAAAEQQLRSRMTSRDSDTDTGSCVSLKSALAAELMSSSQNYNNNAAASELNGNSGSNNNNNSNRSSVGTSILQEKLGQIKVERESEENL